jgi:hypothetical protein
VFPGSGNSVARWLGGSLMQAGRRVIPSERATELTNYRATGSVRQVADRWPGVLARASGDAVVRLLDADRRSRVRGTARAYGAARQQPAGPGLRPVARTPVGRPRPVALRWISIPNRVPWVIGIRLWAHGFGLWACRENLAQNVRRAFTHTQCANLADNNAFPHDVPSREP